MIAELSLASTPASVGRARHAVIDWLRPSVPEPIVEDAALLTSELVTNSVRHSGADRQGSISVRVNLQPTLLRIEVLDDGHGFTAAAPVTPPPRSRGGWGLVAVDRLSDRWGAESDRRKGPGTCVWFEIDL